MSTVMQVRISAELKSSLREFAKRHNMPMSSAARLLIQVALGSEPYKVFLDEASVRVEALLRKNMGVIIAGLRTELQDMVSQIATDAPGGIDADQAARELLGTDVDDYAPAEQQVPVMPEPAPIGAPMPLEDEEEVVFADDPPTGLEWEPGLDERAPASGVRGRAKKARSTSARGRGKKR